MIERPVLPDPENYTGPVDSETLARIQAEREEQAREIRRQRQEARWLA